MCKPRLRHVVTMTPSYIRLAIFSTSIETLYRVFHWIWKVQILILLSARLHFLGIFLVSFLCEKHPHYVVQCCLNRERKGNFACFSYLFNKKFHGMNGDHKTKTIPSNMLMSFVAKRYKCCTDLHIFTTPSTLQTQIITSVLKNRLEKVSDSKV